MRDGFPLLIHHTHRQFRQIFISAIGCRLDGTQRGFVQLKQRRNLATPRRDEIDAGRFVPDNVIPAKNAHQHQHVKRIRHREQGAAKMGTDIITVIPTQTQRHLHLPIITTDIFDPNPGPQIWRPQIDQPFHDSWRHHSSPDNSNERLIGQIIKQRPTLVKTSQIKRCGN